MNCRFFFFFKQKAAYEMRSSDWSSDVCSSDLAKAGTESLREQIGEAATKLRPAPRANAGPPPSGLEQLLAREEEAATKRVADRSEQRRVGNECVCTCSTP